MKLSASTKKIKNSELVALSLALSQFNKKFNSDWNKELHKNLISLEDTLFTLVKSNTNTHYNIRIEGVEDRIITEEDREFDKMFEDYKRV